MSKYTLQRRSYMMHKIMVWHSSKLYLSLCANLDLIRQKSISEHCLRNWAQCGKKLRGFDHFSCFLFYFFFQNCVKPRFTSNFLLELTWARESAASSSVAELALSQILKWFETSTFQYFENISEVALPNNLKKTNSSTILTKWKTFFATLAKYSECALPHIWGNK